MTKNRTRNHVECTEASGKIDFYNDKLIPGSLVMSTKKERMTEHSQFVSNKIEVKCISLSEFILGRGIEKIDYLKMDVEGAENKIIHSLLNDNVLYIISKIGIEYHHNINNEKSKFGEFLSYFEKANFQYQVDARCYPISAINKFQDITLSFHNRYEKSN